MFFRHRMARWAGLLLLPLMTGCSTLGQRGEGVAEAAVASPSRGGLLLRTGAMQLGPGLRQNAYSWQGDTPPAFFQ
jgi:hypothetical protein